MILAPCRSQLVAGRAFAEIFKQHLLNDPEVARLAAIAIQLAPEWKLVFVDACCHSSGVAEWPVCPEARTTAHHVHPDRAKRSVFDGPRIDPIEVVRAAQALLHRYIALLSMLRSGESVAEGLNRGSGTRETILASIWSHQEFSVDAVRGDLLETNELSEHSYDRYIKRYVAVAFQQRPARVAPNDLAANVSERISSPSIPEKMSHVKPKEPGQAPASTFPSQSIRTRPAARVKEQELTKAECLAWLEAPMRASPNKRTRAKAGLLQDARNRWPRLSIREFERLRLLAIDRTGAEAWRHSGAPSKKAPK
jgi:hypothetical protein